MKNQLQESVGNLMAQRFSNGTVDYFVAEGVIYDVKKLTAGMSFGEDGKGLVKRSVLVSEFICEAWVRWRNREMPDTKFIYDSAVGQRVASVGAIFIKSDGTTHKEMLWMFNLDTQKELAFSKHKSTNIELVATDSSPSSDSIMRFVKEQLIRTNEEDEFQKNYDTKWGSRIKWVWTAITAVAALIGWAISRWLGLAIGGAIGWIAGGLVANHIGMKLLRSSVSGPQKSFVQIQRRLDEIKKNQWNL